MKEPVKVLVVDDSTVIRKALSLKLGRDREIEVIGTAGNGAEALEQAAELSPDVITMDINMPVMDGLTALRRLMQENPLPVIMISSLTTDGADETIQALEAGALDFLPKDTCISSSPEDTERLLQKIKTVARSRRSASGEKARVRQTVKREETSAQDQETLLPAKALEDVRLVLIGSSTGGPGVLLEIIPNLPAKFPVPIIIVQHMPANFTNSLAQRLDKLSKLSVREAREGDIIEPGKVYLAPGGRHLAFERDAKSLRAVFPKVGEQVIYKPSVDIAASSLAQVFPCRVLAIMLTGMGNDGVQGFARLKERGSPIIAQSKQSAVIYGMPRAVVDAGLADAVLPTRGILNTLKQLTPGS